MKRSDFVVIYLSSFFFFAFLFASLVKNFVYGLVISFFFIIFLRFVIIRFSARRKRLTVINVQDMESELALMGSEQVDFLLKNAPLPYSPMKTENGFFITKTERIYIACNYKFSPTSIEDVAKFYRHAKKNKVLKVVVLGKYPQRATIVFASSLDVLFKFESSKKLHKFLETRDGLMPKRKIVFHRRKKKFGAIIALAFTKKRAKYFALSSLSLVAFAFFTPMRIYYFVFCAVSLVLAVVCLLQKN